MSQARYRASPYTEAEITRILTCVVAWCGNVSAAVRQLEEEGGEVPREATVRGWMRNQHAELYNSIREQSLAEQERDLSDRYRGVAAQALAGAELGVQKATRMLEADQDKDPSRTAANLATVADKTLRNNMILEGRPTSIKQDKGLPELLRSLISSGILVPSGGTQELPEAEEAE